jgi:magnesium chelatase family protein
MPAESRSSPREIQNYLGCISGPLLDRIDLHVEVPSVPFREITSQQNGEASAEIRKRVIAARQRQNARFAHKVRVSCNARMGAQEIKVHCALYLGFALKTAAPLGQARVSAKPMAGASSQQRLVSPIFDP